MPTFQNLEARQLLTVETPLNLTATPALNDRINLAWTDTSTNELGFRVERSTDGVNFTQLATVSANETSYAATGLTAGTTYQFRVQAYRTGETSAFSNIANASPTATTPNPPANLLVTSPSSSQLNLTWLDASDNEQGYKVERSSDGINFTQVGTAYSGATGYTDSSLNAGTNYSYRVRAYNTAGDSAYTAVVSGTTLPVNAPASLSATVVSGSRIDLSWYDYSSNETGFKVERSTDGINFTEVGTAAAGPYSYGYSVSYQATGLSAGTVYFFRVRAASAQGDSGYTNVISARTSTVPTAPTNLTATAGGNDQINLAWTDTSTNEQSFKIEQSSDGVNFTQVGSTGANQTAYAVTGLTPGTTYSFRVRAYNGDDSGYSGTATAATTAIVPAAPYAFSSTPVSSSQINITWKNDGYALQGFKVERSTDGVNFTEIASLPYYTTSYQASGLTAQTAYTFRIRAYNAAGNSVASETTTAVTATLVPADPTNLTATSVSNSQVVLTWVDNADSENSYSIERSTDGVNFTFIGSAGPNETRYRASGLAPATTYSFRVRASNYSGNSGYTAVASATTLSVSDPTGLTLSATSPRQISLSWFSNTLGELGTKIERSTDGVNFTQVGVVGYQGATSYSESSLSPGTTYFYRVRTYTSTTDSGYSNIASVTTPAVAPPASLSGSVNSSSRIDLSWYDYSDNETGFKVERSTDGINFTEVGTAAAGPYSYGYSVSYQATGLSAGTVYFFRVRATNALGDSTYSNVIVARTASAPTAPANLTATAGGTDRINLAWTDLSTNEQSFKIERSTDGINFTQISSIGANQTAYAVGGLTPNTTYYFRVRASNSDDSPYSNTVSATTIATPPATIPAAPTNLVVSTTSGTQLTLSWFDNSDNEQGFKVERSIDGINFTQVSSLSASFTSYSDNSLATGTTYYYRVRAYNTAGDSAYTAVASGTTLPVNAPASLSATVVSSNRIDLSWYDYSSNETGFKVERSTDGINFTEVGTAAAGPYSYGYSVSYQATGLSAGTVYFFRVRAASAQGDSGYTNVISARTSTVPTAPTNLTATAGGNDRINLAWTDTSTNEQGYKIERSTDGVNFTQISSIGANQTAYAVTGLTPGTTYSFRVRAYNGDDSGYSGTATATTTAIVPAAPGNPTATSVSNVQINLSWTDNSDNEAGYKVERSTDGVNFTEVATVVPYSFSYQATGLAPGTTYFFRIRAYNAAGSSDPSSAVSATTAAYPLTPTNFTATAISGTEVRLAWQDVGNESGYKIERSSNGSTGWTQLADLAADVTTFTDSGLTEFTGYTYRILAYNAAGNAPYSGNATAYTPIGAPDNLAATFVSGGRIDLTWSDRSAYESIYYLEQSPDGTTGWTVVGNPTANATSFSAPGPFTASTSYYFRIRAFSSSYYTWSAYSAVAAVTTPAFPNAPTGVTATVTAAAEGTIALAWTDGANETGYRIERSTTGNSGWTQAGTTAADATSYVDTGLSENTRYYYRVSAIGSAGDSVPSSTASALTPLATPDNLAATFVSGGRIDLTWTDRSASEQGALIEQSSDGLTGWTQVGTTGANATSFAAPGPFLGSTTYYFRVRVNTPAVYPTYVSNYSGYSAATSVTTPAFPTRPSTLTATPSSEGTISLIWTSSLNETGYRIERSADGTTGWTVLGTAGANATGFTDAGLAEDTRYYYRVVATNAGGESAPSATANALAPLATPAGVTASVVSSGQIDLTWTDRSSAESSYLIEQSQDGSTGWTQIGTTAANATSYSAPGPFNGSTTYQFRIRAYKPANTPPYLTNYSRYSASASVATPAFPNTPASVTATASAEGTITVAWVDATNETGYRIERSANGTTGWTQVGTAAANAASFSETGLPENTRYYYRVIATNSAGDSAPSASATAVTLLSAPGNLAGTSVSSSQINLTWTDRSAAESSYAIEQSPNGTTGWVTVGSTAANATSFSAPGPFDGATTYYFRIRVATFSSVPAYSAPIPVTTLAFPSRPTGLSATAPAEATIRLAWADASGEDGYRIERSPNGSSGWAQVGTTAAGVTTYDDAGLPENTRYYYRVIATNAEGDSTPSASASASTLLNTPGDVTATAVSNTRIDLAWTDRTSLESNYVIEQSLDGVTNWASVGSTLANVTSFSASGPFDGSTTYYFRVKALYSSAYSAVVAVTTAAFPSRPSGLSATANAEGTIDLAWADATNETGYRIERSANGTTGWTQVGTAAANAASFSETGLPENTRYYYRVIAINALGESSPSAAANALTPVAAPGGIAATVVSGGRIDVSWTDRSAVETSYRIEQSLDGINAWTQVGSTAADATSFSAPGPFLSSTTYYFRVRALSTSAFSAFSASISVKTAEYPPRPTGLTATAPADGTIRLAWADVTNEAGYRIERSLNGTSDWAQVGTTAAGVTTYDDAGLPENTRYYYRVIATNAEGDSAPSASATTLSPFGSPGDVVATAVSSTRIDLTWTDRSTGESNFAIEQSLDGMTGWRQVGTAAANTTSFSAPGPFNGSTIYYFRVKANATSVFSTSVSVTTAAFPSQPTNLTATAPVEGTISLVWADAAGEDGYRIERSLNGTDGWTQVGTTAAGVTTYNDAGLPENTRYYYRVIAVNAVGDSAPSTTVNSITPLAAPDSVTATVVSGSRIDLTWADRSASESNYTIEQSPNGTTGWVTVGSTAANATSLSAPGPFEGSTTYYFRVKVSYSAYVAYSSTVSATTPAIPSRPSGVTATVTGDGTIGLAWADAAGEDGYRIERSLDGTSGWAQVGTTAADATSYTDAGLPENTRFYYRVVATNAAGDSAFSTTVNESTRPNIPDGLVATAVSNGQIDLTWVDRSAIESFFSVEQSPDGVSGWTVLGTASANAPAYTATGPFLGSTTYYFRVRAVYSSLYSGYSAIASVTTAAFPNAPTGVTAGPSAEGTITVTWADATNETGYRIERSLNGTSGWALLGTTEAGVTTYTDAERPENTRYYYRVVATNSAGASAPSVAVNAVTPPLAPANVAATVVSGGRIDLTWSDRSAVESAYLIEQSLDGATGWTVVGTTAANATSFSAPGPFNGSTTYYFRVRASTPGNPTNYSSDSPLASVATPAFPSGLASVTATTPAEGTILLTWADGADETEYRIERSTTGSGGWAPLGTVDADATSYLDTGLPENTRYYYRVIAVNAAGDSAPSTPVNITTLLATPANVAASVVSGGQIDLTWTDRSAVESSYFIEQSPDGVTGWKPIGSVAANITSYSATGPFSPSTTYYFRVRAYLAASGSTYYSAYSATTPAPTPAYPLTPTGGAAVGSSDSAITLTWNDVADETGYRVQRLVGGTWTTVGTLGADATTFVETGLHEATSYSYRLIATNAAGDAAPSATLTAVTLPSAPTDLVATAVSGSKLELTWTTHSSVTTYYVEQSTDNGATWRPLQTLYGAGMNHYTATGPFQGETSYSYRVRAFGVGYSAYATTSVTTPAFPDAPANVQATVASYSSITISWSDLADESGYRVERRIGAGTWAVLGSTPAGVTSFTDTGLALATGYAYRVVATSAVGDSPYSDVASLAIVRPAAGNDSYAVRHDQVLTIAAAAGVMANDVDAYGYPMSAEIVAQAAHGTVALAPDGSFVYTPAAGFFGTDSFTYRTNNGQVLSNNATVTITVSSLSDGANPAIQQVAGTTFQGTVATFSEFAANVPATSYTAKIDWGDGSPKSLGTVTINAGVVTVTGSHIYARAGNYTVTVPLLGASGASATATGTAVIASASIVPATGSTFDASPGVEYHGGIGQFSVANALGRASDFTATIDWGDGSAPTAGVILGSAGHYRVSGDHRYENSGSYTVTVTILDNAGATATLVASAKVSSPIPSVSGLALTAPANGPVSATVASFRLGTSVSAAGYSATIDWGDGHVTAGTISPTDEPGLFSVTGAHTYQTSNPATILITISDSQGHSVEAESRLEFLTSAGTQTGTGTGGVTYTTVNIASSAGLSFHGRVASFTDPDPAHAAESFSATIDWGDGTTSEGTVVDNDSGGFDVIGSHTYNSATPAGGSPGGMQTFALTGDSSDDDGSNGVTVGVTSPSGAGFTASTVANVGDVPITLNAESLADAFQSPYPSDLPFQGVVATFSGGNASFVASDFTATIDWGDGTGEQAGKVSGNATQGFKIESQHTFNSYGTFEVSVSILSPDGARTVENRQIEVEPPPPNLSGQVITADDYWSPTVNMVWTGTVATIDQGGVFAGNPQSANDYRVRIDWGDGSTSDGEIVPHPYLTTQLNVKGNHTYEEVGSYRVIVTLTDEAGHSVSTQSMAFVSGLTPSRRNTPQEGVDFDEVDADYEVAFRNVPYFHTDWFDDNYDEIETIFSGMHWDSATATIDWGDGVEEDLPLLDALSIANYYDYYYDDWYGYGRGLSHIYTENGSYEATLKVADADGHRASLSQSIVVSDPTLALRVDNAKLTENQSTASWAGGVVASFSQSNPMLTSKDFSAVIDWGDGTVSTGQVIGGVRDFEVVADHEYSQPGAYVVRVIVASRDAGSSEATGRFLVLPTTATAGGLITHAVQDEAIVGEAYSGTVATFTSSDSSSSVSDFTATIDWGDGQVSAGQITEADGKFTVTGEHSYTYSYDRRVTVTITRAGGKKFVVSSSIRVLYPPIEGTTATVQTQHGAIAGDGLLVSLSGLVDKNTYYSRIDWGDGTVSSQGMTAQGTEGAIRGGHTYTRNGSYEITVTVGIGNSSLGQAYINAAASFATFKLTVQVSDIVGNAAPVVAPIITDVRSSGASVEAEEGEEFHGVVSTFASYREGATEGDFIALISWGDGTTSTGLVQAAADQFEIVGEHTYERRGTYSLMVAILDTSYVTLPRGASYNPMPPEMFLENWGLGFVAMSYNYDYYYDYYDYYDYWYYGSWGGYNFPPANPYGNNYGYGYYYVSYLFGAASTVEVVSPEVEFEDGADVSATAEEDLSQVTLATGSTGNANAGSSFTAIVNWGDGTQSIVAVADAPGPDGDFKVVGDHTYASPGTYTATITLFDGIVDYHASCVITVAAKETSEDPAGADAIDATSEDLTASAGELIDDELIATFTVENPAHIGGRHLAVIDWGDHTTSMGTVKKGEGDHEYLVYGSHVYSVPGKYVVHVSIQDQVDSATTSGTITVTGDGLTATGTDVYNYLSKDHVVVARFTDDNPNVTAASFQATIQMGDGSPPIAGEVYGGDGEFYVVLPDWSTNSHKYTYNNFYINGQSWTTFLNNGYGYGNSYHNWNWDSYYASYGYYYWNYDNKAYSYYNNWYYYDYYDYYDYYYYGFANVGSMSPGDRDLTVTIRDEGSVVATVTSNLKVNEATVGALYYPILQAPVESIPNLQNTRFVVTDWGDDTPVTSVPHVYGHEGTYTITYVVQRYATNGTWIDESTETQEIFVSDAPLTPLFTQSQPVSGFAGEEFDEGPLFSFYDNDPNGTAEDFVATISWGDGTTSEGTIEKSDQGTFDVHGTHTYAAGGRFTISVLVEDANGGSNTHGVRQVDIGFDAEGKDFGGYANVATGEVVLATIDGGDGEVFAYPTATVDWGDGETSTATVVYDDEDDEYQVLGNHTYEDLGTYAILVTIAEGGIITTADAKATIADDWSISGGQRTNQPGMAQFVTLGQAAVALNTGGLRIAQDLDFDLSPGTDVGGSPSLVYNSDTVNVRPVIQAEFKSSEDDPVPSSIKVQLTFNGITYDWITYQTTDREPGDTYLLSAQVEDAIAQSGIYAWTLHVVLDFGGEVPDYHAELSGDARVVVNESPAVDPDHPFESIDFLGAGWGLAGLDRLILNANDDGDILWVTGSGDSAIFTRNDDGTFVSPAFDFGTLKRNDDGSYTYTSKYQTKQEFDRLGLMTSIVDRNGVAITYSYTDEGQLEEVTSPDGGVTTFTYDPDTLLLEKIEEPSSSEEGGEDPVEPRVLTFTHENGNLTLIDALDGSERTLTYDGGSRLIGDRRAGLNLDGSGVFDAVYTYDAHSGLLTQVNLGLDSIYHITSMAMLGLDAQYDPAGGEVLDAAQAAASIKDNLPVPTTTTYQLDFEGRILSEVGPDESRRTWVRDSHGQTTRYTDGRGFTTAYIYDYSKKGAGDLTRIVNPDKTTEQFQYDPKFHRVTVEVDPNGHRTKYAYDQETGDLLSVTDPLQHVTRYTWSDGLLQTVISPRNSIVTATYTYDEHRRIATLKDALDGVTTYTYDGNGNVLTTEDAAHRVVTTTYDASGRLVQQVNHDGGITTWAYNVLGQVVEEVDPVGTTISTYDARGFLKSVTVAAFTAVAQTTSYQYDAVGRIIQTTDYRGKVTRVEYNDTDRTRTVTDALGGLTTTAYDANGNVSSVTDANGHKTTYEYDRMDRLVLETNPLFGSTTTEYDKAGNVTLTIDPLGQTNVYTYDDDDQLIQSTDAMGYSTFYKYDEVGNLTEVTDPRTNKTIYGYDELNRQTLVLDPMGGMTQTDYNAVGDVVATVDANIGETTYTYDYADDTVRIQSPTGALTVEYYDQVGRLVLVEDPRGKSTWFDYDALGRETSRTDGLGHIWTTEYVADSTQNLKIVTDPLIHKTTYAYDDLGRLIAVSDDLGNTTKTRYDAVGNVTGTISAREFTTIYAYDANDRLTSVKDPLNGVTRYDYDDNGNVTQVTDALGRTTTYSYDANNRRTSTADPLGFVTGVFYDENGNVTATYDGFGMMTTYSYDKNNRRTSMTDPLQHTTTYDYDAKGNLTKVTDPLNHSTEYSYDGEDRLLTTTDALGFVSGAFYDAAGNVTSTFDKMGWSTTYSYDANNRRISQTDPLGHTTTIAYDAAGNVTGVMDALGHTTTYGYDDANRRTQVTDAAGHTTTFQYDPDGNVTGTIDPGNYLTIYTYDALGRRSTVTLPGSTASTTLYDAVGNVTSSSDPSGAATTYSYDGNNRQITVTSANHETTTIAYDANGQVDQVTDASNNVTAYEYDVAGRKIRMIDPLGKSVTYGYDAANRLTTQRDRNGRLTLIDYDAVGRATTISWYDATTQLTDQFTRSYDGNGRLLTASNSAGTVGYDYDIAGRVTDQTDVFGLTTTYTYDEANRLTQVQDSLGGTTASGYYDDNRLKNRTMTTTGNAAVARVDLAYDPRGLATTITYSQSAGVVTPLITRNTVFDAQGRIQSIAYLASTPTNSDFIDTLAYAYDPSGRLTTQNRLASTVDSNGQLLSPRNMVNAYTSNQYTTYTPSGQLKKVEMIDSAAAVTTTLYDYDSSGNVKQVTVNGQAANPDPNQIGPANQLLRDATWVYTYDDEGNLATQRKITTGEVWSYTYNNDNRLIKVEHRQLENGPLLDEITYTYDALGRFVERKALKYTPANPSAPPAVNDTRYAVDASGNVWADLTNNGGTNQVQERYLRGAEVDQIFAREDAAGNVQWYLTDRLGSVIDLVDSQANVDQRIKYTATGSQLSNDYGPQQSFKNRYGFTGKYQDPVSILQYNNARWYDPSNGRWTSQDPMGFAAGDPNLYRYVFNDPTNLTDPTGNFAFLPLLFYGGLALATTGAVGLNVANYERDQAIEAGSDKNGIIDYDRIDQSRYQRAEYIAAASQIAVATGITGAVTAALAVPTAFVGAAVVTGSSGTIAAPLMATAAVGALGWQGYEMFQEGRSIYNTWDQMSGPERLSRVGMLVGPNAVGFLGSVGAARSAAVRRAALAGTTYGGLSRGIRQYSTKVASQEVLAAYQSTNVARQVAAPIRDSRIADNYTLWPTRAATGESNPYNWNNGQLQRSVMQIHEAAFGTGNGGGIPITVSITKEGRVILSQVGRKPGARAIEKAEEIFGKGNVEVVAGTTRTNAPGVRGQDAEARGIHFIGTDAQGAKQFSSHYACEFCDERQQSVGIINPTGVAAREGGGQIKIPGSHYDKSH